MRVFLLTRKHLLGGAVGHLIGSEPDRCDVAGAASHPAALCDAGEAEGNCIIAVYDRRLSMESFCRDLARHRRVLVVSPNLSHDALSRIRTVAAAILSETATATALLDAVHAVARGQTWRDLPTLGGSVAPSSEPARLALTERQELVLNCLYEGFSNKQIAERLEVSYASVKATIQQLFLKAGARNRAQLVRTAIERIAPRCAAPPPAK